MKITPRVLLVCSGLSLLLVLLVAVLFLCWSSPGSRLAVVSANASLVDISAGCTFGTNHLYVFGGPFDRFLDAANRLAKRSPSPLMPGGLGPRYESHLETHTPYPSSVIWAGFRDPAFATSHPTFVVPMRSPQAFRQFRGRLTDKDGKETSLETVGVMQDALHGYFVGGWCVPGPLEAHQGATLRIELTNDVHIVTFRLP